MELRYMHIRRKSKRHISARNPQGISNLGGSTLAFQPTDGGLIVAVQHCFSTDNFVRREGRDRATAKFLNGETETIVCHDVETIRGCLQRWYDETFRMGWGRDAKRAP